MTTTLVTMLSCGQGAMTLVEIYEDLKKPAAFLALIDCGSDDGTDLTEGAIKYVTGKVQARKKLDLVVLSHQDADHVNLLPTLGARLGKAGATVTKIWCCGKNWKPDKTEPDVLCFAKHVGYDPLQVQFNMPRYSDYDDPNNLTHIAQYKNIAFRILMANMPTTTETEKNQSSGVVVVENTTSDPHLIAVLPGDITCHTMGYIYSELKEQGQPNPDHPLTQVVALAAPHHGARATAVTRCGGKWENFDRFARTVRPQHIGISAGPNSRHKHPRYELISRFKGEVVPDVKAVLGVAKHTYATYEQNKGWCNETTTQGIWSTVPFYEELPQPSGTPAAKRRRTPAGAVATASPPSNTKTADIVITLDPKLPEAERVKLRPPTPSASSVVRDLVLLAPAP